jgi:hypothetical protein
MPNIIPMLFSTNGTAKRQGSKLGGSPNPIPNNTIQTTQFSEEEIKKMIENYNNYNNFLINLRTNMFSINNIPKCSNCNGNK